MKILPSAVAQLRSGWRVITFVLVTSALFIAAVLVVSEWKDVPTASLTRDPTAALEGSLYIGFLSQVGLLFWAASGATCLLGARVLSEKPTRPGITQFLMVSGLLAFYLGIDDAFRLHEDLFPKLGVPQKLVQLIYFSLMVFYLIRWRSLILRTEYTLLGLSLAFFGTSVAFDIYPPTTSYLIEDAAKFVGLVAWLVYFCRTVTEELRRDSGASLSDTQSSSPHVAA